MLLLTKGKTNWKYLIIVAVAAALAAAGILLLQSLGISGGGLPLYQCSQLEGEIKTSIKNANYCNVDADCMVLNIQTCPFGCFALVNKDIDAQAIQEKIGRYEQKSCSTCIYSCIPLPQIEQIKCINNQCMDTRSREEFWGENDFSNWQTYRNEEFGFEVKYPEDWSIENTSTPGIRIQNNQDSSLSIYPHGWATSLPNGKIREGEMPIAGHDVAYSSYLTEGGEEWGRFMRFSSLPSIANWTEDNWMWMKVKIHNGRTECATEITPSHPECNIEDRLLYFGTIDEQDKDVLDQILSTFRFVEEADEQTEETLMEWDWQVLGCGSQAPCSYRVSSAQSAEVYSCVGKFNSSLGWEGEVMPTSSTDPRTTTDFDCEKQTPPAKFSCNVDADCTKHNTCSEECVNTEWKQENPYEGPACGPPWQYGCKCINNQCESG